MSAYLRPLKRLFASIEGGAWGSEPDEGDITLPCIRGTDFDYAHLRAELTRAPLRGFSRDEVAKRSATRGDLIVEKSGGGENQPVGRVVLHDLPVRVMPTNFAGRLRTNADVDPRFACYLLASLYTDGRTRSAIKQTTGIQNLDLEALMRNRVGCPPPAQQRAIADYLDAETARIDALSAKRRRMIELLSGRLSSAIETATLGSPPLASTRSRWHPQVGRGREIRRIKYVVTRVGSGKTPSGGAESYVEEGIPLLRSQNVMDGVLDLAEVARIPQDVDADMASTRVHAGDVLLNITGASLGRCAVAPLTLGRANVNQHVCIIRPMPDLDGQLLHFLIRSCAVQDQIFSFQVGGNRDGLNFEQVRELEIVLPSRDGRTALVEALSAVEGRHRDAGVALQRQIDLLVEHRQTLITAAVTGELDIPVVAA